MMNESDNDQRANGWTPLAGVAVVCALVAATAVSTGCPSSDPSSDDEGGDSTGASGMGAGHSVRCTYEGYFNIVNANDIGWGFQTLTECLDPEVYGTDVPSLQAFCQQKCGSGWTSGLVLSAPWTFFAGGAPAVDSPFDGCQALPIQNVNFPDPSIVAMNDCTPSLEIVPYASYVPPNYGGFFRDGSMGVDVAGADVTLEYELAVHFALDDCDGAGIDGGTCTLVMSTFDMNLHDIALSGGAVDYQVSAELRMTETAVATVFFDECGLSTCEGTFEFSVADENAIQLDLEWTQVNPTNSSTGHGFIHLANDGVALGGVDELFGTIEIDPLGESGVMIFDGNGSDSFGGDFAEAWFGIYGYIETIDTDVGDCCATQVTGGCSNEYIKACVWVHDPDCYNVEWDASCVTAVESYGCGVCP